MKNWKKSAVLLAGALVLTACGTQTEEETTDTAARVDTTSQVSSTEETYEEMLAQGKEEYEEGLLDAAGGTIALLLENDLSQYSELEAEATSLQEEIKAAQAEEARVALEEQPEETTYTTERKSALAAEEFSKATGEDIEAASDEQIETWLTEKEQAEAETVAAETEEGTEESEAAPTEEERLQQEKATVLEAVSDKLALDPEGHEFFLVKTDEQTYQVEIRQPHAVEEVEISNLVGIFEYNLGTESLKKMNPITGEFEEHSNTM